MSNCNQHNHGNHHNNWNCWNNWGIWWPHWGCGCNHDWEDNCPYSRWRHPIYCCPAYYSCAGTQDGPTLVIHAIPLEAGCEQSCTPRTFRIRITGPSYPCGEIFSLRAGSCLTLDEPLVISGLEPGQYQIEVLFDCPRNYLSTITGADCGGCVQVTNSAAPTVVTIVSRRRVRCPNRCGCNH